MKQPAPSHANIPITGIHPNDLTVLESVLKMYLLYLRHSHDVEARIQRTQRLHQCLNMLITSPQSIEGTCIPFTEQEFRTIDEALSSSMNMLRQIIAPSPQRVEVLEALQGLQQQFAAMLSAHLN